LKTIALEKQVAEVSEEQVQTQVDQLAAANRTFDEKDGAAEDGDAVVIDFVGTIDGVAFEGGAAEKATVVIGAKRFIPGFEEGLTGAKKGDTKDLNVTFPDDYAAENLAGKAAVFAVTVHEVRAPQSRAVDDEFAKTLGLDSLDALKTIIREQIEREHNDQSRLRAKRALFDKLEAAHEFPLPQRMVDQEFEQIWRQVEADKAADRLDPEDKGKSDEDLRAEYRKIAERRVKLGLLLAEVGRRNNIQVTDQEVAQAVTAQARQFPGQEKQIFEFYQKNPNALASVRAPIYEEKTVDFILELADVKTVTVDRETLFAEMDPA
jgi:trigger factor